MIIRSGSLVAALLWLAALLQPAAVSAQSADAARLAAMQSNIFELQDEIRRLTGRIEQLEYENRRLEERMNRLVGDVDNRLLQLDQTAPAQPAAPVVDPNALPTTEAEAPAVISDTPEVEAPVAADGTRVLGTIPRGALLDLPEPNLEAGSNIEAPASALSGSATERYEAAITFLRVGNIDAAEASFRRFLEDFPDDGNAPSAAYWVGEALLSRGDYATAAATFARNVRTYGPDAQKAPDNLLKLGMSLNGMGDAERACASYDELERRYSELSVPLRQALARERIAAACGS